jgi:hypothetical protein
VAAASSAIFPLLLGDFCGSMIFSTLRHAAPGILGVDQIIPNLWDNFPIFTLSAHFFAAMIALHLKEHEQ